ncbi:MAG: hypothetical protein NVV63_00870 [Opitutus sp.]|nr:hypothetical protein [Opitutus sp.]
MISTIDFTSLAGRTVLVRTTLRRPDLPVTLRGTIELRQGEGPEAVPCVHLVLPGSATTEIPLDDYALKQLLASEQEGEELEFFISPSLD